MLFVMRLVEFAVNMLDWGRKSARPAHIRPCLPADQPFLSVFLEEKNFGRYFSFSTCLKNFVYAKFACHHARSVSVVLRTK